LLALGGVYLIVDLVLDLYRGSDTMLANRRMLAARLSAAAAELPGLRARLAELQGAASTHGIILDGASDAIASANLQSRIEEQAASAGVTIGSTEGLAAENRGGYRRIGLRLAISGEYDAILELLGAIESATPPLVIDTVQIRGILRRPGGVPTSALDARVDVYGFRSNEQPSASRR
jgi:general secretion pathway protein M